MNYSEQVICTHKLKSLCDCNPRAKLAKASNNIVATDPGRRLDVVFDWDQRTEWTYFDGVNQSFASKQDLLDPDIWLKLAGKVIGVEKAHFVPRLGQSSAQIYTAEELQQLARFASICTIYLLPESQSYRARQVHGTSKQIEECYQNQREVALQKYGTPTLEITEMYWRLYRDNPQITLQTFPVYENLTRRKALSDIKEESNKVLNSLRVVGYPKDHPLMQVVSQKLLKCFDQLSDSVKGTFVIRKGRNNQIKFNNPSVMAIASICFNPDGELRTYNGKFIGVDTVMRALTQNPYKGKRSGTARSNLMHHRLKKSILKGHPREDWAPLRSAFRKDMKKLIKLFRDA